MGSASVAKRLITGRAVELDDVLADLRRGRGRALELEHDLEAVFGARGEGVEALRMSKK
jgi:hypothetical protein